MATPRGANLGPIRERLTYEELVPEEETYQVMAHNIYRESISQQVTRILVDTTQVQSRGWPKGVV